MKKLAIFTELQLLIDRLTDRQTQHIHHTIVASRCKNCKAAICESHHSSVKK